MKRIGTLVMMVSLLIPCMKSQGSVNIIPLPEKVVERTGHFTVRSGQTIGYSDASLRPASQYLRGLLAATGYRFSVKKGQGQISLRLTSPRSGDDEQYTLSVTPKGVVIQAHSYRGIIDGIASLRQLLPDEIESKQVVSGVRWTVPCVEITDRPAYGWRGLMLDVSRHFFTKQEVERLLDNMALYKLNKFHWHLTDDPGWRVEIKKYPLLTQVGAWRKLNGLDQACLSRMKAEHNPDFNLPKFNFQVINGDSMYGGYYTQDDIREVVKYAAVRGIDVIPELDMPGHCSPIIASYPSVSCAGQVPLCPGKDATLQLCQNIYHEIISLFPYQYIHLGADEVDMTPWKTCPDCQARIKAQGLKSEVQLHAWFVHQMENYFNQNGRRLIGWDEILEGGLSATSTVAWWRGDHGDVVKQTTEHGNEVVLCPTTYVYFDYGQDNGTLQRLYNGGIVPDGLSAQQLKLIKGMQGNIWGEIIPSEARMQFMTFPRAIALAERAWTPQSLQSWEGFQSRLEQQLKRLDVMKVHYRPLISDVK